MHVHASIDTLDLRTFYNKPFEKAHPFAPGRLHITLINELHERLENR